MSRLLYPRIAKYCKDAKLSRGLDPIILIGKIRQGRLRSFALIGDSLPIQIAASRFLDRVTLHLLVGQPSDATESLYREIDR